MNVLYTVEPHSIVDTTGTTKCVLISLIKRDVRLIRTQKYSETVLIISEVDLSQK